MPSTRFLAPPCQQQHRILHEDGACLVVEKPAGLLSVPGRHPDNQDCLISRVQQTHPDALIVHRLDMATSGLMVLARGKDSHRALSLAFQQRQVEKQYQAVVWGQIASSQGVIDLPLACDWPNRPRQHINFDYGKAAQTGYQCVGFTPTGNTHILLNPITGRSHQLRVHMAAIGHPILGCEFYAHKAAKDQASRLLLHASRLAFSHPTDGRRLTIEKLVDFSEH